MELYFLIGADRSGTTLLSNLLNNHSKIIATPEQGFLLSYIHSFAGKKELSDHDLDKIIDNLWIRKSEFSRVWRLNEDSLKETLLNGERSFENVFKQILRHYDPEKKGVSVLVDKNPFYSAEIKLLRKTFPNAKFIGLVRDCRDRFTSQKLNASKIFSLGLMSWFKWNWYNQSILDLREKCPDQIHLLKYEDLVSAPEGTLEDLLNFLQLSYEPEMINRQMRAIKIDELSKTDKSFNTLHEHSGNPISSDKVGYWKNNLSEIELKRITLVNGKIAKFLGYSDFPEINRTELLGFRIKVKFDKIKSRLILFLNRKSFALPFSIQRRIVNFFRGTG